MGFSILSIHIAALSVLFFSSARSYMVCPTNICSCKWKNGKQTAECVKQRLTVVPDGVDGGTQVIDLSRNVFEAIPSRVFQLKGLVNLQKIFLAESGVQTIAPDAFFQLSNLVELDLSGNRLTHIPAKSLRDCPHLRRLQLARNPIKYVGEGALTPLSHLTFLDLSKCEIETLQPGAFSGLAKLEFLNLYGNRISSLTAQVVEPLTQLSGLHLHGNPWDCDCRLRNIRKWMLDQNIPLVVPPHCFSPKQSKGNTWDLMSLEDFACSPNIISPRNQEVNVILGQNASITCEVDSVPTALIYWEISGRYLSNISSYPEYRGKYVIDSDIQQNSQIQTNRLTVVNVVESDSEVYTCVAENRAGNTSLNLTISVVMPYPSESTWGTAQITVVTVSVLLVIIIAVVVICLLVFHPATLTTGAKLGRVNVFKHLKPKKQDSVEMNDISVDKEEKEFRVSDKQPRHETGSSGYGSDQLTPDLVSKIVDTNHVSSLSASTVSCSHPDLDRQSLPEGYGPMSENWLSNKPKPPKYDDSPGRSVYSEIYPNPCYGKDDPDCFMMHQPEYHTERYLPQNDRVRTLRAGLECSGSTSSAEGVRDDLYINSTSSGPWKKSPLNASNNVSHYTLPTKARFSPDEGYAEDALEGTEV